MNDEAHEYEELRDSSSRSSELSEQPYQDRDDDSPSTEPVPEDPQLGSVIRLLNHTFQGSTTTSQDSNRDIEIGRDSPVPTELGRFTILNVIGAGGFGTVYRAFDSTLHRDVAIKAVRFAVGGNSVRQDRRLREARAAAQLSHPNLVPVYEVFEDDDSVYLVSEFCEGPTLADWLKQHVGPVDVGIVGELLTQIAEGVAYIHERGLVHRDIKPRNVLLFPEKRNGDLLRYAPRLTDFGLAHDILKAQSVNDSSQSIAGTLAYMAPEQILGEQQDQQVTCDIYSFGVLMYRMLTGRMPQQGKSGTDLVTAICYETPVRPRSLAPQVAADLEAICLKCLAKDPAARYATGRELADDLTRWRLGLMVDARPQWLPERAIRTIRRSPLQSVFFIITLALGTSLLVLHNQRLKLAVDTARAHAVRAEKADLETKAALKEVQTQRETAKSNERTALKTAYLSDLRHAYAAWNHQDSAAALSILQGIERYAAGELPMGTDLRMLKSLVSDDRMSLTKHRGKIEEIKLIPGGKLVAIAGEEGVIRIHRSDDGVLVREIQLEAEVRVRALAISRDGHTMAIGKQKAKGGDTLHAENSVAFLRFDQTKPPAEILDLPATVDALDFSADGQWLAIGCRYEPVLIVPMRADTQVVNIESNRRNEDLLFAAEASKLLLTPKVQFLRVCDPVAGDATWETSVRGEIRRLAWSPDGKRIACSFQKCAEVPVPYISLIEIDTESSPRIRLEHPFGSMQQIHFSPNGRYMAAALYSGGIVVWDLLDLETQSKSTEADTEVTLPYKYHRSLHDGSVSAFAIDQQGRIISGDERGEVIISHLIPRQQCMTCSAPMASTSAAIAADGRRTYLGCANGELVLLDHETMEATSMLEGAGDPVTRLSGSRDGKWLAIGWANGESALLQLPDCKVVYRFDCPENIKNHIHVNDLAFDTDCRRLAVVVGQYHLQVLGIESEPGRLQDRYTYQRLPDAQFAQSVRRLSFADEAKLLLFSDVIRHYNCTDQQEIAIATGVSELKALYFDGKRQRIYSGSDDGHVRAYDLQGNLLQASSRWLPADLANVLPRQITSLTVTPDGASVVTGSPQGEIAVWNAEDLRYLGALRQADNRGPISELAFSADSSMLIFHQVLPPIDQECGLRLIHVTDTAKARRREGF